MSVVGVPQRRVHSGRKNELMSVGLPVIPHQDLIGTQNRPPRFDLSENLNIVLISENPCRNLSLFWKFAFKTNTCGRAPGPFAL